MEINIRNYDNQDFDAVLVLWRISRELSSNGAELAGEHPLWEDALYMDREILAKDQVWVAIGEDGKIVAFLAMVGSYIDRLYVLPKHWHKGVGRKLIQFAISLSPSRVWLHTLANNDRAKAFYEKFGFTKIRDGVSSDGHADVMYEYKPGSE